jgi:hypothetical protein
MINTAVYFFADKDESLRSYRTIDALESRLEFEPLYNLLIPSEDANGHLVDDTGESLKLNSYSTLEGIRELLLMGKDIKIFNNLMQIEYATNDPMPHILIRWLRKWFHFLDNQKKQEYLNILFEFAILSNSSFVIFLEDLFDKYDDRFEDRLNFEGEKILLDDSPKKRSKWNFTIDEIWQKEQLKLVVQSQRKLTLMKKLGNGFASYKLH